MAPPKDRLHELVQVHNRHIRNEFLVNNNNEETENSVLRNTFQRSEEIREHIEIIIRNTRRANEILQQNVFHVTQELQGELELIFLENEKVACTVTAGLKEFRKLLSKSGNAETRIANLQYNTLKQSFKEALQESSTCLEYHKNKRKNLLQKSLKTMNKDLDEEQIEELIATNKIQIFTDNYLSETRDAKRQLADIQSRHKELIKIEEHLKEVLDLFVQISTFVDQQQESVNRVEYYAESATNYVEQGAIDLGKTEKRKRKFRKRKIYILCLAMVLTTIIIISFIV